MSDPLQAEQSAIGRAFLVGAIAFAALLCASYPQVLDPFIRHDDFPAFWGDEALYLEKTLSEGRWLNYWWVARPVTFGAPANYLIYQLGWAVFAAAVAVNVMGKEAGLLPLSALAVLASLSPQALLISFWFNTLIPGVWVVAIYGLLSLVVSSGRARALLLIFVPLGLLSYSTHPLLMLLLCLTRRDARHSFGDLVRLGLIFGASLAVGMLAIGALNYQEHGVFGMEIAAWRNPSPATDLASLGANLALIPDYFKRLYVAVGFGNPALSVITLALFAVSIVMVFAKMRGTAIYILLGVLGSLALMLLHGVKEGIEVPVRSLIAIWVYFSISVTLALSLTKAIERVSNIALVGVVVLFGAEVLKHNFQYTEWQRQTQAIAEMVPDDATRIFVYGDYRNIDGSKAASIQHPRGLRERLRVITGVKAAICAENPDICEETPPFDPERPETRVQIETVGSSVFILLPAGS